MSNSANGLNVFSEMQRYASTIGYWILAISLFLMTFENLRYSLAPLRQLPDRPPYALF